MKSLTDRHWNERALCEADEAKVNIADTVQRDLELKFVFGQLSPGEKLLEVGCGNGFVTRQLRERAGFVDAFDYAEHMVERARARWGETNNRFFHDNLLAPQQANPPYDIAVCIRVLINLRNLEEQRKAIERMADLLRPGGRLILIEGFRDGFDGLNELRKRCEMAPFSPASINFYSNVNDLMPLIDRLFTVEARFHTGLFDFLTRVVYPALVGAERASGPSDFHGRIEGIVHNYDVAEMAPLARLHGFALRKRDERA